MAYETLRTITHEEFISRRDAANILERAYNDACFRATKREDRESMIEIMRILHHAWVYLFLEKVSIIGVSKRCDSYSPIGRQCGLPTAHTGKHSSPGLTW